MTNESELSEREREIICLVATGASNKEIAQRLFISTNTVKVHLRNIFAKIGVTSRTEATLFAIREGLVPAPGNLPPQAAMEGEVKGSPVVENGAGVRPPQRRGRMIALLSVAALVFLAMVGVTVWQLMVPPAAPASQQSIPRWQERTPLPSVRSSLAAAVYDNNIYVIGGEDGNGVTNEVNRYLSGKSVWEKLASKPTPVADISAVVIGEKIYIPGGTLSTGKPTAVLETYDPRHDLWETRRPLPIPISRYGLAAFEGKIYLFGGWDGDSYLNSVYMYNPEGDAWVQMSSMAQALAYPGVAIVGEKIYIFGGFDGKQATRKVDVFFPDRDLAGESPWLHKRPLPNARYGMGVVTVADSVYILGGQGGNQDASSSWVYSTNQDEWQPFENSPFIEGLSSFGIVALENHFYILGGKDAAQEPRSRVASYQALYTIELPILSH